MASSSLMLFPRPPPPELTRIRESARIRSEWPWPPRHPPSASPPLALCCEDAELGGGAIASGSCRARSPRTGRPNHRALRSARPEAARHLRISASAAERARRRRRSPAAIGRPSRRNPCRRRSAGYVARGRRARQHLGVGSSRRRGPHRDDIVPCRFQSRNGRARKILVGQKAHPRPRSSCARVHLFRAERVARIG